MKLIKKHFIITIIIFLIFSNHLVFNNKAKVGIIDGVLSNEYINQKNIEYSSYTNLGENESSKHGEEVLKIVLNKSDAKIYYYNVEESNMKINVNNVIKALNELSKKDIDIINMSLSLKKDNKELKDAIKRCQENGILIVCSVDNMDIISYPAAYENVISVSNEDSYMQYQYLVKTNKYNCNSYRTASVTNFIINKNLENKSIEKIYKYLRRNF